MGFFKLRFAVKYQNLEGGPFGDKKNRKKSHSAEKNLGGPYSLVPSGFVSYDKNGVTERGDPLHYLKCAPRTFAGPVV